MYMLEMCHIEEYALFYFSAAVVVRWMPDQYCMASCVLAAILYSLAGNLTVAGLAALLIVRYRLMLPLQNIFFEVNKLLSTNSLFFLNSNY